MDKSLDLLHTFELPVVHEATQDLISRNAEHLIKYIYDHKDQIPYNNKTVRVGLVLKTLLKSKDTSIDHISTQVVAPAISDLSELITAAPTTVEKRILTDELKYLEQCTLLDELISLNTTQHVMISD